MNNKLNFKITPKLHRHLEETLTTLTNVGHSFVGLTQQIVGEFEAFFAKEDELSIPVSAYLEQMLAMAQVVKNLRTFLGNDYTQDFSQQNIMVILKNLQVASQDRSINAIGENASLQHLYMKHGKELRELQSNLSRERK